VSNVELPTRENADRCVSVCSINTHQGISRWGDIVQDVAKGLEVVDFVPLGHIEEFNSIAILTHSPSAFRIGKTKFCPGIFGFVLCVLHTSKLKLIAYKHNTFFLPKV